MWVCVVGAEGGVDRGEMVVVVDPTHHSFRRKKYTRKRVYCKLIVIVSLIIFIFHLKTNWISKSIHSSGSRFLYLPDILNEMLHDLFVVSLTSFLLNQ